jgi:hypothetical protein
MSYVFICIYGKEIFELWLGKEHFIGYKVLITLSIMMLLEAHHGMLNMPCIAAEKLQFYKYTLLGGFINLGLILMLIQRWYLFGVAISILIAHLATNNWIIPKISLQLLEFTFRKYFFTIVFPVLGAGLIAIIAALAIRFIFSNFIWATISYCLFLGTTLILFKKNWVISAKQEVPANSIRSS